MRPGAAADQSGPHALGGIHINGDVRQLHRSPEHRAATSFTATVAISFANGSATLGETLTALAAQQDAPDFEVLLVSNATTDDSVAVAHRHSHGLAVRMVECESVGYDAKTRNVSMVEAARRLAAVPRRGRHRRCALRRGDGGRPGARALRLRAMGAEATELWPWRRAARAPSCRKDPSSLPAAGLDLRTRRSVGHAAGGAAEPSAASTRR